MKENVFIIHRSEIVRKGIALILQDYFKMEITELSSANDLKSFTGISKSAIILILEANAAGNSKAVDKLKEDNDVYLVGFYDNEQGSQVTDIFDYQLNQYSSPIQIQKLIQVIRQAEIKQKNTVPDSGELTIREKDVIKQIALGLANKEIAEKLFISVHTVISHRKNITEKLSIKSISGLTVYAIMNNLLDIQDINPEELI